MDDHMVIDDAIRALALLEEALALLDNAGLTLAAVQLDHVVRLVEDAVGAGQGH